MTKKKTLLKEGTVRQFMKLANLKPLASDFVESLYEKKEGENPYGGEKDGREHDAPEDEHEDKETEEGKDEADYEKPTSKKGKKRREKAEKERKDESLSANPHHVVSEEAEDDLVEVDLGEEFEVEAEEEIEEPAIEDPELEGGLEDEVSITPEEADTIIGLADKLAAAKGEESVEDFDDET